MADRDAPADRKIAAVEAWLADHPEIGFVSRDRRGGYGEAAARALPHAIQIAYRWYLRETRVRPSSMRCALIRTCSSPPRSCNIKDTFGEETNAAIMKLACPATQPQ